MPAGRNMWPWPGSKGVRGRPSKPACRNGCIGPHKDTATPGDTNYHGGGGGGCCSCRWGVKAYMGDVVLGAVVPGGQGWYMAPPPPPWPPKSACALYMDDRRPASCGVAHMACISTYPACCSAPMSECIICVAYGGPPRCGR